MDHYSDASRGCTGNHFSSPGAGDLYTPKENGEFPKQNQRLFDTIDTNKDGLLTIAEDIAYRTSRSAGKRPQQLERSQQARQADRTNRSQVLEGVTIERDKELPSSGILSTLASVAGISRWTSMCRTRP